MLELAQREWTSSSTAVPGWPNLEPPYPSENEVSRHVYTKNTKPLMIVCKLVDGSEERFYLFENSFEARWTDEKPSSFLSVLYNHDSIKQSRSEPIFYVETEPEADQLTALGLLATTFGRPAAFPAFQKDLLQGRTVLAVGRAGEDGEVHVNAVRDEYKSVATVRTFNVERPSGFTPPGYRLADWLRDTDVGDQRDWLLALARGERYSGKMPYIEPGGAPRTVSGSDRREERGLQIAAQRAPTGSAQVLVFGVGARGQIGTITANDNPRTIQRPRRPGVVLSNEPSFGMEPEWLVQDVLPETGTGMIYAPSMAGKSFIGIDLCYAVENGLNWAGRDVKPGRAFYVSAEHSVSVCRRANFQFEAQHMERPFSIIRADSLGLSLAGNSGGLERLIDEIEYERGQDDVRMVFVDTFETIALGVDENSSSAVGQVWACLAKISARFNCFVLVAHHTGKTGDNYRGSSTLMNRPETVISINVSANGRRRLEIEKQRDGVNGLTAEFDLETDPGTSHCRPVFRTGWHLKEQSSSGRSENPKRDHKESKIEQVQSAILEVLEGRYDDTGVARVTKEELRQHPSIISSAGTGSKDAFRKCLTRAIDALSEEGLITVFGNLVMRLDRGRRPLDTVPDMSTPCSDNPVRLFRQTG